MSKKLRTPIIMPRKQGGTFYTFGSAMEDIGLNINESHNRVEISHYVLLDIPNFANNLDTSTLTFLNLTSEINYSDSSTQGDFIFADQFQNYCLNFETVLRNQDNYNYASNKTVSERAFWKWLFGRMKNDDDRFVTDGSTNYIYEKKEKAIAKAFGAISAGSQRTDDSGLYNETFVQIPSSYGQMRVLFKKVIDENYIETSYEGTNINRWIENIDSSEITQIESKDVIKSTGISPVSKSDSESSSYAKYIVNENIDYDKFEVEFDINKLRTYYNNSSLTYDDIGMGKISKDEIEQEMYEDFRFNAILVYYSIYDANKTKRLATNAYGLYILDGAIESSEIEGMFYFPSILKAKSGANKNGSSYSFRINVKPSTAYSGDITVNDNSTAGYSMSEDFNDVLRNLTTAVTTMKENAKTLYSMAKDSKDIKQLVSTTMEKIDGIESDISNIKNGNFPYTASEIYTKEETYTSSLLSSTARTVLNSILVSYNYTTGKVSMKINTDGLSGTSLRIANALKTSINENNYIDIISIVALLVSRASGVTQTTSNKIETIANSYDQVSPLTAQTI